MKTGKNITENTTRPKLIGITGGIGSGKTTVSNTIKELGFSVYNSDESSKKIVNSVPDIRLKVIHLLGNRSYTNGVYDTKYISQMVFNNPEVLEKLNQIIHPEVDKDFQNWKHEQNGKYIFKETALLFELGLHKKCDLSLLVTADENIRIERVMARDGKIYEEIKSIIKRQMPEIEKIRRADIVIYNNGSKEELKIKIKNLIKNLIFVNN
ncbi:MAG: dephospho-CoA kinase [Bergeyella sp.]|nr:dephospho-CoA kinase [Bergeyella sp.]